MIRSAITVVCMLCVVAGFSQDAVSILKSVSQAYSELNMFEVDFCYSIFEDVKDQSSVQASCGKYQYSEGSYRVEIAGNLTINNGAYTVVVDPLNMMVALQHSSPYTWQGFDPEVMQVLMESGKPTVRETSADWVVTLSFEESLFLQFKEISIAVDKQTNCYSSIRITYGEEQIVDGELVKNVNPVVLVEYSDFHNTQIDRSVFNLEEVVAYKAGAYSLQPAYRDYSLVNYVNH